MQPTRGATRVARAGILGTVTLLLALTGHLIGGGTLPSPGICWPPSRGSPWSPT